MTSITIGLAIAVLVWVPLLIVGSLDPTANPIGLGLLAWAGSVFGVAIAVGGVLRSLARLVSEAARDSGGVRDGWPTGRA